MKPKPPKVPAGLANEMLYRISRVEQRMLSPLSMPFGSSLMIIGTKQ
jgi:hypothetical protein